MTKDDLKVFCGWKHPEPWSNENYTYATNGSVLVRVKKLDDVPIIDDLSEIPKNADSLIDKYTVGVLGPFPEILKIVGHDCHQCKGTGNVTEKECPECEGDGDVYWETNRHKYEAECQECDGRGKIRTTDPNGETCEECDGTGIVAEMKRISVDGFDFDSNLLYHFQKFPNVKIGAKKAGNNNIGVYGVAFIKFDDGVAVIMGVSL